MIIFNLINQGINQQNTSSLSCLAFLISSFSSFCQTLNLTSKNCKLFIFLIISIIPSFDSLFDIRYRCDTFSSLFSCFTDSPLSWLFVTSKYVRFDREARSQAALSVKLFLLQDKSHNDFTSEMYFSDSSFKLLFLMSSTFSCFSSFIHSRLYDVNLLFAKFNFYKFINFVQIMLTVGLPNRLSFRIKTLNCAKGSNWRVSSSVSCELGKSISRVSYVTVRSRRETAEGFLGWVAN